MMREFGKKYHCKISNVKVVYYNKSCNIEFFARYNWIFFKYCAIEEHEIWPKYSLFYILYKNALHDEKMWKNIAMQYIKYQCCLLQFL